jgi:hypothetical protein
MSFLHLRLPTSDNFDYLMNNYRGQETSANYFRRPAASRLFISFTVRHDSAIRPSCEDVSITLWHLADIDPTDPKPNHPRKPKFTWLITFGYTPNRVQLITDRSSVTHPRGDNTYDFCSSFFVFFCLAGLLKSRPSKMARQILTMHMLNDAFSCKAMPIRGHNTTTFSLGKLFLPSYSGPEIGISSLNVEVSDFITEPTIWINRYSYDSDP